MSRKVHQEPPAHMIGELFTFALFGLFLLLSLLVVVIGVENYRGVVDASDTVSEIRTPLGYMAGKLRSGAAADGVTLDERGGMQALVLTEVYKGTHYETIIYHHDGALYETYINADETDFDPDIGTRLTEMTDFSMAWADEDERLLALTATASDGSTQTLHIALRTEQGVNGA